MKVIFFVTEDWYFCSHRLALGKAMKSCGHDVVVASKSNDSEPFILDAGFRFVNLDFSRQGGGLLKGLRILMQMIVVCRRERPDIIHNIALKPVLFGSLAGRLAGVPLIINTVAGLGHLFISEVPRYKAGRRLLLTALKLLFKSDKVRIIVQNYDDLELISQKGVATTGRVTLIPGAGVDVKRFHPAERVPLGVPIVLCHSRMLWTKGIGEFAEAAKLLKEFGCAVRMVLVGAPDPCNPESISPEVLQSFQNSGNIEYWGFRSDIDAILRDASVAVLPSYREGLPKSLVEAAASGLPLVAFDVPGCRSVVRSGENGLLVPLRDSRALADAIRWLLDHPAERARMGLASRRMALDIFDQDKINRLTMQVGALI